MKHYVGGYQKAFYDKFQNNSYIHDLNPTPELENLNLIQKFNTSVYNSSQYKTLMNYSAKTEKNPKKSKYHINDDDMKM